ncbi:MAG: hypothetical protein RLZZ387_1906 [Chloroflexota bacterium]
MRHTTDEIRGGGIARELGFFALYLVLIVLGLFVGLVIWREALYFVFYGWIDFGWWARFLYMTTVILGSFLLVVGLLAAEPYLNTGKQKGQLLRRFVRAAVPIAALGLIGWLVLIIGRAN